MYANRYFERHMAKVTASHMTATRTAVILRPFLFEALGFLGFFQGLLKTSAHHFTDTVSVAVLVALVVAFAAIYVSVKMLYDE